MNHYQGDRRRRRNEAKPALDTSGWTAECLAWVAGLLEGEGCFKVTRPHGYLSLAVKVNMTDRDVLARLPVILGVGNVTGPYRNKKHTHYKPHWCWAVGRREHVLALVRAILPQMGQRRQEQIRRMLEAV